MLDMLPVFLALVIAVTVGAAVLRLSGLSWRPQVPLGGVVYTLGGTAALAVLIRIVFPPGLGETFEELESEGYRFDVTAEVGVFLSLAAACGIAYGGYRAMREEGMSFTRRRRRGMGLVLVLAAVALAGCGGSGPGAVEPSEAQLEKRAERAGFDGRLAETFATASAYCGAQPKSEFVDASFEGLPTGASDAAVAHAYADEWPRRVSRAVFEGCMEGLARVPARPPPSSPLARDLWNRNFIATSVSGRPGKLDPPIQQPPQIRLDFSGRHRRSVGWKGRCNGFGGEVRFDEAKLEVEQILGTAVGCGEEREGEDEWLLQFMNSKPEWQLEGTQLTLTSEDAEVVLEGFRDPNSCLIASSGGRIDFGAGVFGCESALSLLTVYASGKARYLQGWKCRQEEQTDGLDTVYCHRGKSYFTAEDFDLGSLRPQG